MKDFLTLGSTLLIVIGIIYFSYHSTRFIGKGYATKKQSKYLNILEQVMVGQDRSIAIIQVGLRYYLVGIAPSGITKLAQLGKDELMSGIESESLNEYRRNSKY